MYLSYPYVCEINSKEEAVNFIKNRCSNCGRYIDCSGINASKCDDVVAKVVREFSEVNIKIDVPNDLRALAGYSYGKYLFETFVEPKMNKGKIVVTFPDYIDMVAVSFVQGFISKVGIEVFNNQFEIKGNPEFTERFLVRVDG